MRRRLYTFGTAQSQREPQQRSGSVILPLTDLLNRDICDQDASVSGPLWFHFAISDEKERVSVVPISTKYLLSAFLTCRLCRMTASFLNSGIYIVHFQTSSLVFFLTYLSQIFLTHHVQTIHRYGPWRMAQAFSLL